MSRLCQEIAVGMPAADAEREILRYFELHRRGNGIDVHAARRNRGAILRRYDRTLDRRAHRA